ncbi:hypothetical protein TNCV_1621391 [Trichonephila clavipes]|nr:hypothetical protein TNCV_1621391 [Trichonephila clavipes]
MSESKLPTDFLILNHGQVMRTTPEQTPHSPKFHTIQKGRMFEPQQNVQKPPLHGLSSLALSLNSGSPTTQNYEICRCKLHQVIS